MDKKQFIEIVGKNLGSEPAEVEQVLDNFLELASKSLNDEEKISIADFGTFSVKKTKPRRTFNALLNKEIEIPAKTKVSFSATKSLAEDINERYANLETKVIQENIEKKIEKKVTLITSESEVSEPSEMAAKFLEELDKKAALDVAPEIPATKFEFPAAEKTSLSLADEMFESLISEEGKKQTKTEAIEKNIKIETKSEGAEMPNMNLNEGGPKFVLGEEIKSPSSSSTYKRTTTPPTGGGTPAGYIPKENSSPVLWITLVLILIGIIGIGIYWALSTDVTDAGKDSVSIVGSGKKGSSPPVLVQDQKTKAMDSRTKKEIILMPEEYKAEKRAEETGKEKAGILIEEKKEPVPIETKSGVPVVAEVFPSTPEIVEVKKPVSRPIVKAKKPVYKRTVRKPAPKVEKPAITEYQPSEGYSDGVYFIQVYSYTNQNYANTEARVLRNKGYRAFVETANIPGKGLMYRVLVGKYKDEDAAAKDYHGLRLLLKNDNIYVTTQH
ncbi:MAG: HU family DNA-binding protein [Bacteroidetes bacterium]|nr:HU family DNA-binding protein [Bacteroidota bacterium]MBU2584199.1 HU family DNA-binding protein [Bacteroidota bacterium]